MSERFTGALNPILRTQTTDHKTLTWTILQTRVAEVINQGPTACTMQAENIMLIFERMLPSSQLEWTLFFLNGPNGLTLPVVSNTCLDLSSMEYSNTCFISWIRLDTTSVALLLLPCMHREFTG
jgi:hypothetical protein